MLDHLRRAVDQFLFGKGFQCSHIHIDAFRLIKCADHVIDLGPGGGEYGGKIIATGTPEDVSENPMSLTGKFLKKELQRK